MAARYAGKYCRSPYPQAIRIKNIQLLTVLITGENALAYPRTSFFYLLAGRPFLLGEGHVPHPPPYFAHWYRYANCCCIYRESDESFHWKCACHCTRHSRRTSVSRRVHCACDSNAQEMLLVSLLHLPKFDKFRLINKPAV